MSKDKDIFAEDGLNEESEAKLKQRRERELSDIRKILSLPEGRRFVWRIWGMTGTFRASYIHKDTNHTMFREGQRDIGMRILEDINVASPMAYSQMKTEYMSEQMADKKETKNDD